MKTYNIGIIGFGGFGQFLYHGWRQLPNVNVMAVAEEDSEKTKGLSATQTFTNWRNILLVKEIDLVAIVTPPHTHLSIATACMEAGKHVLIEKPLATTLDDAQKIVKVRDRKDRVAGIDFIMRFNPLLRSLRRLTRENVFGRLRRVDVENYAQDDDLPPWFWKREHSGGILVEHAVHFIDLVHFLQPDKVLSVQGMSHHRNPGQEDQVMANVLYEGGLIATHYHSFSRPGFFEATKIKLAYDLADIELHGWIPLGGKASVLVNDKRKEALLASEFFEATGSIPVEEASDESRPEGWGLPETQDVSKVHRLTSSGISYELQEVLTGHFSIGRTKTEVYRSCVQDLLLDVLRKVADPSHELSAPLETGISSLEIAIAATSDL